MMEDLPGLAPGPAPSPAPSPTVVPDPTPDAYRPVGLTKAVLSLHTQKEEQAFLSRFRDLSRLRGLDGSSTAPSAPGEQGCYCHLPEPALCWSKTGLLREGVLKGDVPAPGTQAGAVSTTSALPRDRPLASLSPLGRVPGCSQRRAALGFGTETGRRRCYAPGKLLQAQPGDSGMKCAHSIVTD